MKKATIIRQWNIPGIQWRIRLTQKKNGMYIVRMQPFHDVEGLKSYRWYAFLPEREFETESGAAWSILNRLDCGDL